MVGHLITLVHVTNQHKRYDICIIDINMIQGQSVLAEISNNTYKV